MNGTRDMNMARPMRNGERSEARASWLARMWARLQRQTQAWTRARSLSILAASAVGAAGILGVPGTAMAQAAGEAKSAAAAKATSEGARALAPGGPLAATFWAIGPQADEVEGNLDELFAESLNARQGFAVKFVPRPQGTWLTPPPGAKAGGWVALVMVATGEHRDAVVLVPDEKGQSVLAAVRRPCRYGSRSRRDWVDPGPWQIPINAMKEVASDLGHRWQREWVSDPQRRVQVSVAGWKVAPGELGGGLDATIKGKEGELDKMEAAAGPALEAAQVLAFAALAEAGFEPTTQAAGMTLRIEVAQGVEQDALRLTLARGGKESKLIDRHVQRAAIYEHLRNAGKKMLVWGESVRDVAKMGIGAAEPLGFAGGLVLTGVGHDLRGIDPASGLDKWRIAAPERGAPRYFAARPAGGEPVVLRVMGEVGRVEPAGGKVEPVAAGMTPASVGAISLFPDGRAAVVHDSAVSVQAKGKALWKVTFAEPIVAGPGVAGERVIVGTAEGDLVALGAADGKEAWRVPTGLRLGGPIGADGDLVIVGSSEGTWRAVKAADGSKAWDFAGRDVPLTAPVRIDGSLVLADKGNLVALVDAASGASKATFASSTWLRGMTVTPVLGAGKDGAPAAGAKRWVVCSDLRGTVWFLSTADLKPVRQVELKARLSGVMLAGDFPVNWAANDDLDQKAPGLLVGDAQGWLYLLDLPR